MEVSIVMRDPQMVGNVKSRSKIDDLGVPSFLEITMFQISYVYIYIYIHTIHLHVKKKQNINDSNTSETIYPC